MPQIRIEYTDNIVDNIIKNELLLSVHNKIHSICGIRLGNCKSRLIKINNYFIAEGDPEKGFIHAEIKFLEGRGERIKKNLGEEILEILKKHFIESLKRLDLQITVLIEDLPRRFYFKHPEGTIS